MSLAQGKVDTMVQLHCSSPGKHSMDRKLPGIERRRGETLRRSDWIYHLIISNIEQGIMNFEVK